MPKSCKQTDAASTLRKQRLQRRRLREKQQRTRQQLELKEMHLRVEHLLQEQGRLVDELESIQPHHPMVIALRAKHLNQSMIYFSKLDHEEGNRAIVSTGDCQSALGSCPPHVSLMVLSNDPLPSTSSKTDRGASSLRFVQPHTALGNISLQVIPPGTALGVYPGTCSPPATLLHTRSHSHQGLALSAPSWCYTQPKPVFSKASQHCTQPIGRWQPAIHVQSHVVPPTSYTTAVQQQLDKPLQQRFYHLTTTGCSSPSTPTAPGHLPAGPSPLSASTGLGQPQPQRVDSATGYALAPSKQHLLPSVFAEGQWCMPRHAPPKPFQPQPLYKQATLQPSTHTGHQLLFEGADLELTAHRQTRSAAAVDHWSVCGASTGGNPLAVLPQCGVAAGPSQLVIGQPLLLVAEGPSLHSDVAPFVLPTAAMRGTSINKTPVSFALPTSIEDPNHNGECAPVVEGGEPIAKGVCCLRDEPNPSMMPLEEASYLQDNPEPFGLPTAEAGSCLFDHHATFALPASGIGPSPQDNTWLPDIQQSPLNA